MASDTTVKITNGQIMPVTFGDSSAKLQAFRTMDWLALRIEWSTRPDGFHTGYTGRAKPYAQHGNGGLITIVEKLLVGSSITARIKRDRLILTVASDDGTEAELLVEQ